MFSSISTIILSITDQIQSTINYETDSKSPYTINHDKLMITIHLKNHFNLVELKLEIEFRQFSFYSNSEFQFS